MGEEWRQCEVTPHCPECHPHSATLTQDWGMQAEERWFAPHAGYVQKEGRTENNAGNRAGRGKAPERQQRAPADRKSREREATRRPRRMRRDFRKPFAWVAGEPEVGALLLVLGPEEGRAGAGPPGLSERQTRHPPTPQPLRARTDPLPEWVQPGSRGTGGLEVGVGRACDLLLWEAHDLPSPTVRAPPPAPPSPSPPPLGGPRARAFSAAQRCLTAARAVPGNPGALAAPLRASRLHPTPKPADSAPPLAAVSTRLSRGRGEGDYGGGAAAPPRPTPWSRPLGTLARWGRRFAAASPVCSNSSVSGLSCCLFPPSPRPNLWPSLRFPPVGEAFNAGLDPLLGGLLTEHFFLPLLLKNFNSLETSPFPLMYSKTRRLSRLRRDYFLEGHVVQPLILEMRPSKVGDVSKVNQLLRKTHGQIFSGAFHLVRPCPFTRSRPSGLQVCVIPVAWWLTVLLPVAQAGVAFHDLRTNLRKSKHFNLWPLFLERICAEREDHLHPL